MANHREDPWYVTAICFVIGTAILGGIFVLVFAGLVKLFCVAVMLEGNGNG